MYDRIAAYSGVDSAKYFSYSGAKLFIDRSMFMTKMISLELHPLY